MINAKSVLILLVCAGLGAAADGEKQTQPSMLRITAEWFAMPADTCSKLLEKDRSGGDAALREEVRALVARGEAKLLDLASGTTFPGEPVRVSSVQELIHPTEYQPNDGFLPEPPQPEPLPAPQIFNAFPIGLVPPAFETKELGSRLEAELVLRPDGKSIAASVTPSWSLLAGWNSFGKSKDAHAEVEMRMPRINILRFKSQLIFTDGVPMLVGVLSPSSPEGVTDPTEKMLIFLRVDVLRLPE
jgi:hypothetical protein